VAERPYVPLADYGIVGDLRTAALIARDGSLDWLCVPRFDSGSVFGRILDSARGGSWRLAPVEPYESTFAYEERTAVLATEHRTASGAVRIRDAFLAGEERSGGILVRACEGLAGTVELESALEPRFEYGLDAGTVSPLGDDALLLAGGGLELRLASSIAQRGPAARFSLQTGQRAVFLLGWSDDLPRVSEAESLLDATAAWWRRWSDAVAYSGPYEAAVVRSAITLKLLSYEPSGALVAAPTTSLPERPGGDLNWDYRYTWLRDASLTLYALLALGLRTEGDPFFDWICSRVAGSDLVEDDGLRVMYDVDGGSDHRERELSHLDGYLGSRPVRVGNAACTQTQLDIYGEVLDCFSTAAAWGRTEKLSLWEDYRPLADWICVHWERPDAGIWELRGADRHYVHSKVMAWVALDRAIRDAEQYGLPGEVARWRLNADLIHRDVLAQGWDAEAGAFRQSYDGGGVDAANLLLGVVGFLPPADPRVLSNLDRTRAALGDGGLLVRFHDDGDVAGEGAFTLCSFWLVNALAAAGRVDEAAEAFEDVLARGSSPLGLLSEEVDPTSGALLGNHPQCFVHAGLVSAAVNLARAGGIGEAPAARDAPAGNAHLVALRPHR
jgi:GH15 family glucan-1,4-alpha-glucosidase